MRVRRNGWEIAYRILKAINSGESRKTRIMYAARLDWRTFSRYILELERDGFVEFRDPGYVLTERGRDLLRKLEDVVGTFGVAEIHAR